LRAKTELGKRGRGRWINKQVGPSKGGKEYDGKLTIKEAFKILDWYEYFLEITEKEQSINEHR